MNRAVRNHKASKNAHYNQDRQALGGKARRLGAIKERLGDDR
jgi:hypothetical protein